MLKLFLILFGAVYIGSIISVVLKLFRMRTCLRVLADFLSSCSISSYGELIKGENFNERLEDLLFHYPVICKFSGFYDPSLSYGENPIRTYKSAAELYNTLRMKSNFLINDLAASFNPINTLKKIVSFPSLLIEFFGFHPGIHASRLLNLIGWISAYVLGMYQDEIKSLIDSFLRHS